MHREGGSNWIGVSQLQLRGERRRWERGISCPRPRGRGGLSVRMRNLPLSASKSRIVNCVCTLLPRIHPCRRHHPHHHPHLLLLLLLVYRSPQCPRPRPRNLPTPTEFRSPAHNLPSRRKLPLRHQPRRPSSPCPFPAGGQVVVATPHQHPHRPSRPCAHAGRRRSQRGSQC